MPTDPSTTAPGNPPSTAPTTAPASSRPNGRDEVRAAVLAAAGRRFAAQGTSASLRDIAADAGVNLGLIHRHFGNKDDLLRAVLHHQVQSGSGWIATAPDAGAAVRLIFETSTGDGLYVRILAWLLLEQGGAEVRHQDEYPGMAALRALAARQPDTAGADDERLMVAMAAIYGWTVFGSQVLTSFGRGPDERAATEERIASLLQDFTRPRPAAGGARASTS